MKLKKAGQKRIGRVIDRAMLKEPWILRGGRGMPFGKTRNRDSRRGRETLVGKSN